MTAKDDGEEFNIRQLQDSEEDAKFAARMVDVAFGTSFGYKLPRLSFQQFITFLSRNFKNQPKELYERSLILQSGKENAGFIQLNFHDSSQQSMSLKDKVKFLGIRGAFWWMLGTWLFLVKPKPGTCFVYALAVDENHRKKGYGQALLKKGDEIALSRMCSKMQLYMVTDNKEAKPLYEKHGYVAVKENITMFGRLKFMWGYPSAVMYEKQLYQTSPSHRK